MIDSNGTYIPEWRDVQRVIELTKAAGGRLRTEAHLPTSVSFADIPAKGFPKANRTVPSLTSGCKMHARINFPDAEGNEYTTLCAVCDAADLFPRIARELT